LEFENRVSSSRRRKTIMKKPQSETKEDKRKYRRKETQYAGNVDRHGSEVDLYNNHS